MPDDELAANVGLFVNRIALTRILFLDELYRRIVGVHGAVFEFGLRWGRDLATLIALRGIYEPFNYTRKIVGFDTFAGFAGVDERDGASTVMEVGAYGVSTGYEAYLDRLLRYHESECPVAQLRKFALVVGDASETVPRYLTEHPETIVALAYFDMDVYRPTRDCLRAIRPHLTKGSIVAFDELANDEFPGETLAMREVFELDDVRLLRGRDPGPCYLVIE